MRIARALFLVSIVTLAGCSAVTRPAAPPGPVTDHEALVVFLGRTSRRALVYDVSNTDTERFVGIVEPGTKVAYASPPGSRRFMVIGESADFLDADLAPGKTYYALVTRRLGWWMPRFSFRPVRRADAEGADAAWIAGLQWVEPNERGQEYAAAQSRTVHQKKVGNLAKYEAKNERDRDRLRLEEADGL